MAKKPLPRFQPEDVIPPSSGDRNGIAVAAFVLGLISVPLVWLVTPPVLAVIFGVVGWRKASHGAPHGGLALLGLWLGIATLFLLMIFAFFSMGNL